MCASGACRISGNGQSQALSSNLGEHAHRRPAAPARCRAWQRQQRARLGPLSAITRPLTMESLARALDFLQTPYRAARVRSRKLNKAYQNHTFPLGQKFRSYGANAKIGHNGNDKGACISLPNSVWRFLWVHSFKKSAKSWVIFTN